MGEEWVKMKRGNWPDTGERPRGVVGQSAPGQRCVGRCCFLVASWALKYSDCYSAINLQIYRFELWARLSLFLNQTSDVAVHWGGRVTHQRLLRVQLQRSGRCSYVSCRLPRPLLADDGDRVSGIISFQSVLAIAHFLEIVQILFYSSVPQLRMQFWNHRTVSCLLLSFLSQDYCSLLFSKGCVCWPLFCPLRVYKGGWDGMRHGVTRAAERWPLFFLFKIGEKQIRFLRLQESINTTSKAVRKLRLIYNPELKERGLKLQRGGGQFTGS